MVNEQDDKTSIKISKDLRDTLAELGSKDDTFEDIIRRLVNDKR